MRKRMIIMLAIVGVLFGAIFGYKMFVAHMMMKMMSANAAPAVTVSAAKIKYQKWQPHLKAAGNSRAVQGVDVTTEIGGLVRNINFMPGAKVKKGDLLVKLNIDADVALLNSLKAAAELSKINYTRDKAQYAFQAVSKATVDADAADLKSKMAQVAQQQATLDKKIIRAPFTGRLGISAINLGQLVNPGDKIVTLQSLDPIYIDFYVPQQALAAVSVGQVITLKTDTFPDKIFSGKVTTIDSKIDPATRNVEVEATVANSQNLLVPGMFGTVEVSTGKPKHYLTLPLTAINYNPYGDFAFVVKQIGKDEKGKPILKVTQTFVTVGEERGNQVAILKGLKEGQMVVTSGVNKLKNNDTVNINNKVVPNDNPAPNEVDH